MVTIHEERHDHVLVLTMEGENDLNIAVVGPELNERLLAFRDDDDAWCAVITGAGKRAFTAGGNLNRHTGPEEERPTGDLASVWQTGRAPNITGDLELWKPLIAAINGYCIGAGMGLALACDIRIASENAEFGIPEIGLGAPPGLGLLQRLPRTVGIAAAMEMLLTGDRINAAQALEWGLVSRVVPQDELMDQAMRLADRIASRAPLAVRSMKELIYRSQEMSFADAQRLGALLSRANRETEDADEARRALREKRTPQFKGR
jgi:enoyl-CoA hydratase/carnithine racemase